VGGVRPIRRVAKLPSGFVTLAIYGMAYRLWPAMKKLPLALAQFWITVIVLQAEAARLMCRRLHQRRV
jgi:hypothetical protein